LDTYFVGGDSPEADIGGVNVVRRLAPMSIFTTKNGGAAAATFQTSHRMNTMHEVGWLDLREIGTPAGRVIYHLATYPDAETARVTTSRLLEVLDGSVDPADLEAVRSAYTKAYGAP
jgi:hypothetical protein